jgi:hypothetical protein
MKFDFLKEVKMQVPEMPARKSGGPRKAVNPENADLRLFADGSIYPSAALVEAYKLEYGNKPEDVTTTNELGEEKKKRGVVTGFGFDVIDSEDFNNVLNIGANKCIWISPVPREEGRVDLFASVTYNEDGTPKTSVLEQGSTTFGKEVMIPLLEKAYGITIVTTEGAGGRQLKKFSNGQRFVDLKLMGNDEQNNPWIMPAGKTVCPVPKYVQRGEEKGKPTIVRRDNPYFFCLVPVVNTAEEIADAQGEVTEEVEEPATV